MSPMKPNRSRSRRFGVAFEEEKAWIGFYRRVGIPAIAVEVMTQLESDPEMKRTHLALYLCCKESLRSHKARQVRNKRIGYFVRTLLNAVFVLPVGAIRRLLRHGGDIAVECLPEVSREPAKLRAMEPAIPQTQHLSEESEYSQAQSEFGAQTAATPDQKEVAAVKEGPTVVKEVEGNTPVVSSGTPKAGPAPTSKAAKRLQRRQPRT